MSQRIVVEERPGLYVSELFPNLRHRNKKPQLVEGQPPPPFNPAPLREFLRVMNSSSQAIEREPSEHQQFEDAVNARITQEVERERDDRKRAFAAANHRIEHLEREISSLTDRLKALELSREIHEREVNVRQKEIAAT